MFNDIETIAIQEKEFYEDELRESCRQITRQLFHANEKPLAAKLRGIQFLEAVHNVRPDLVPNIDVVRRLVGQTDEE